MNSSKTEIVRYDTAAYKAYMEATADYELAETCIYEVPTA